MSLLFKIIILGFISKEMDAFPVTIYNLVCDQQEWEISSFDKVFHNLLISYKFIIYIMAIYGEFIT